MDDTTELTELKDIAELAGIADVADLVKLAEMGTRAVNKFERYLFAGVIMLLVVSLFGAMILTTLRLGPAASPFEFVADPEIGTVTNNDIPIYPTDKGVYEIGDTVKYSAWAMVHGERYILNPVFTLATAENDARIDVCQFLGDSDFKRNITRGFDFAIELKSERNTAECLPRPKPGVYYIEVVNCTEGTLCSAYLAGPFELK